MANESIDKILNELKRIESILKQSKVTGKIRDIERDIILSKLRNIYEIIHILQPHEVELDASPIVKKEPIGEVSTKIIDVAAKQEDENKKIVAIHEEVIFEEEDNLSAEPKSEKNNPVPDEISLDINNSVTGKPLSESVAPVGVKLKQEPSGTILAEKFQENKSFLNEALANYQYLQNIAKKYQTKPIADISSAISLNDKFLYIKELFNNDANLYKQTIEVLNNSGDFNSAIQYIDENFQWDINDFQVQKIMELVHRRYMSPNE